MCFTWVIICNLHVDYWCIAHIDGTSGDPTVVQGFPPVTMQKTEEFTCVCAYILGYASLVWAEAEFSSINSDIFKSRAVLH